MQYFAKLDFSRTIYMSRMYSLSLAIPSTKCLGVGNKHFKRSQMLLIRYLGARLNTDWSFILNRYRYRYTLWCCSKNSKFL